MGGLGSGRPPDVYSGTVEECLSLDVNRFAREGSIGKGCQASGIISWDGPLGIKSSIGFEAQCFMKNGYMRLQYTVSSFAMGEQVVNYNVELITTKPHLGGVRWWFICPNQDCEKMVAKLYQPPGARYFLCRTCQNLTYTSCRDSHKYDSYYKQIAADTGLDIKLVRRISKNLNLI